MVRDGVSLGPLYDSIRPRNPTPCALVGKKVIPAASSARTARAIASFRTASLCSSVGSTPGNELRRKWRKVAEKAGVPKSVRNMDSHGKASDGEPELGADTAL
jgi:hypothetical protein